MTRTVVLYPKGADPSLAFTAAMQKSVDISSAEFIEDTSGYLTENILIFDKPDYSRSIEPQLPKIEPLSRRFYWY